MLRYVLLAGAMTIAAPALAQTTSVPAQTAPAAPTPNDAQPATAATATPQQTEPDAQAAAQPATGDQVAQVVDSEFPTYDKNGDGKLSETEFAAWMVALKTQSDPATKADSPATKTWIGAAFAQADKDKSRTLSKAEVTGFLSQGQS